MDDSDHPTSRLDWQKLVKLGEQILELGQLEKQQNLVKQSVEEFFDCKVIIWFSREAIPISDRKALPAELYRTIPSYLMQGAVKSGLPVTNIGTSKYGSPIKKNISLFPLQKISIPISSRGAFLGALELTRSQGAGFNIEEFEFLEGLTAQVAISMQASRQIATDRRQLKLLSLVRKVSSQIVDLLDIDILAQQVTALILTTFHYYYVAIFTIEPGLEYLTFRHSASLEPNHSPGFEVRIGEGIIGYVALHGTEVIANDVSHDPRYREIDVLPETKAEVSIPLKIENRILGVLDVQSDTLNAFQETDMLVLNALADHIAIAIENVRLYGDIQHRAAQLRSIGEVSNAIRSILDEDMLLTEVVRLLRQRLGYLIVNVFVVQPGRRKIIFRAGEPPLGRTLAKPDLDLDDETNLVSWVAKNSQTRVINRESNSIFSGSQAENEKILSEISVPLIYGNDVLGVLNAQSDLPNAFSESDRFVLEALADSIAISMRNAYLYRSEQWRRKVAESMREVASLLTTNAGLEKVLQLILKKLETTLPIDAAGIWLIEQITPEKSNNQNRTLKLAAVNLSESFLQSAHNKETLFTPDEIILYCNQSPIPSQWLQEAINENSPKTRGKNSPYEPLGAILDFPEDYSAIAAPLTFNGESIGVLTFTHQTPGRYGHEAQNMAATFASYAAVAIENTRLYEAAHDQAWISTILLQVAEATQSLDSLDELLETIALTPPSIMGVSSCSIFLWDSNLEVYIPTTSYGLTLEQENFFTNSRILAGEINSFDQLHENKSPIQVSIEDIPQNHPNFFSLVSSQIELNQRVFVFPMITHGDILGAFLITLNSNGVGKASANKDDLIDWEDKFALIQGIAHQTAVAVENIQLLRLQKEEAYVSIALLQVAQAVVSINDINELIETIVRLTPILIGVKRCAIFLQDQNNQYKLVDSYGIARSDLEKLNGDYYESEFPLLDAVCSTNLLAYYPIREETEHPLNWLAIAHQDIRFMRFLENDDPENRVRLETSSGSQYKEFLYLQNSLLFAFPLSVKGKVLGVMITQEMDFSNSATLIQAREKRYEISIGITQQTALAIQNNLLQREVIDRERLEREFQLARQIQQTFLPQQMPILQNWEVAALWRPARAVGGDFFDLIEVSDDDLSLVIADVADKGMPAALFMTLIRTLIRAVARETSSPARILERVNDLLVPDAKQGLFVTVAFISVNLKSGLIRYANAGHNPPLVIRRDKNTIEDLPRTGMALGVVEGLPLEERELVLNPGDCLVMYTDGITESFSQSGEMYGEQKLREVIAQPTNTTVMNFINSIDKSVSDFINGHDYSDDLTLLALYRQDNPQDC